MKKFGHFYIHVVKDLNRSMLWSEKGVSGSKVKFGLIPTAYPRRDKGDSIYVNEVFFLTANLSNVEKQEIKTVRIVKRESERRQRDRERSLQPLTDWPSNTITTNLDQFIEDELVQSFNNTRASSLPRTDYYKNPPNPPNYLQVGEKNMELSPKYISSPSLSYDYSQNMSSLNSSYSKSYNPSGYDRMSLSAQYTISPTESTRTLTNEPMAMSISKTSSIVSLTRSNMELSPIFKSEAAKQIITEMSGPTNGSLHRRQVPKEKRRHYTAPHHLSAKTLNELPKDAYNQDVSTYFRNIFLR